MYPVVLDPLKYGENIYRQVTEEARKKGLIDNEADKLVVTTSMSFGNPANVITVISVSDYCLDFSEDCNIISVGGMQ